MLQHANFCRIFNQASAFVLVYHTNCLPQPNTRSIYFSISAFLSATDIHPQKLILLIQYWNASILLSLFNLLIDRNLLTFHVFVLRCLRFYSFSVYPEAYSSYWKLLGAIYDFIIQFKMQLFFHIQNNWFLSIYSLKFHWLMLEYSFLLSIQFHDKL